ncbi:MAG: plasmid pRiA4b ORF-3 family protein [Ruminococcus sp.]|nr:plasmid pRiA4b ORF-3 family protein [Ruminococcus sp.]
MKKLKKSYVISVSLGKRCYRHIQISANDTLECLSDCILSAFDFSDEHLHAFFMDNRQWSEDDAYFHYAEEDAERHTCDYTLEQAHLEKDKQFKYIFDFGDAWTFQCKVLSVLDVATPRAMVVESKGKAPNQYTDYAEDYYDDEDFIDIPAVDIAPELYEAAFNYRQTKLWKKLYDTDMFAVELSNGETGYCTVMGRAGEHIAIAVYIGQNGWNSFKKLILSDEYHSDDEMFEVLISQDCIQCEFVCKADISDDVLEKIQAYGKANGISFKGKNSYPDFIRYTPYKVPWAVNPQEQKIMKEVLLAATYISERLESGETRKTIGLDDIREVSEIPLLKVTENGVVCGRTAVPESTEIAYPTPEFKKTDKLKKLKKKASWECEAVCLRSPSVSDDGEIPGFPIILIAVNTENDFMLVTEPFHDYNKNAEQILDDFVTKMIENKVCPGSVVIKDKRTEMLLKDFCDKCGIIMMTTNKFSKLDAIKAELFDMQERGSIDDDIQMILNLIDSLSEEEMAGVPIGILQNILTYPDISESLRKKIEKVLNK